VLGVCVNVFSAESRTNCSGPQQRHLTTEERLITELFRDYDVDARGV